MNDGEIFTLWQRSLEFMERQAPGSGPGSPIQVLAFARAVEGRVRKECARLAEARADERASASTRLGPDGNPCWAASQVDAYAATELRALAGAIRAGGGEGRRE